MSSIIPGYGKLTWDEMLRGSGYAGLKHVEPEMRNRVAWMARRVFRPLRDQWGRPLKIVRGGGMRSWLAHVACYRGKGRSGKPPRTSRHLFGDAFDPKPLKSYRQPGDMLRLYHLADKLQRNGTMARGGLAIYLHKDGTERFLHIDGRGRLARWNTPQLRRAERLYGMAT